MPDHEHTAVEKPAIDQLVSLGYQWGEGAEFAPITLARRHGRGPDAGSLDRADAL